MRFKIDDGLLKEIWYTNFDNRSKVIIPEGVEEIDSSLFYYNEDLKEVILPKSCKIIHRDAFACCTSLEKINLDNIEEIGSSAFISCTKLNNINLTSSLKSIGLYAFDSCTSLEKIFIPASVKSMGDYSFSECRNLKEVIFEPGLKTISTRQFSACINLNNVVIPESIVEIGNGAFELCLSLKTIEIKSKKLAELELICGSEIFLKDTDVSIYLNKELFNKFQDLVREYPKIFKFPLNEALKLDSKYLDDYAKTKTLSQINSILLGEER